MSVSRLVVGIVCLGVAAFFFRARRRLRDGSAGVVSPRAATALIAAIAWVAGLVGVLWVLLAFS